MARAALGSNRFGGGGRSRIHPDATPDGKRLFAANTPDNRIEVFHLGPAGLTHLSSIPVGLRCMNRSHKKPPARARVPVASLSSRS